MASNRAAPCLRSLAGCLPLAGALLCGCVEGPELPPLGRPQTQGELRVAAEWEPALGVLVSWPLHLPSGLLVEIAKDDRLYVMVAGDQAEADAEAELLGLGIALDAVTFIRAPQGYSASWTRDWGPFAVFDEGRRYRLADPRYFDTPISGLGCDEELTFFGTDSTADDLASVRIAETLGYDIVALPFILTGGNVMFDGQGKALSTCILLNENRGFQVSDTQLFGYAEQYLGIGDYAIVSNFEPLGIQHIDCLLKLLDAERLLVVRAPSDHGSHAQYEAVVGELSALTNAYGRPYEILRIDTARFQTS
jgi:agmatine/peptidylarginine deiminase